MCRRQRTAPKLNNLVSELNLKFRGLEEENKVGGPSVFCTVLQCLFKHQRLTVGLAAGRRCSFKLVLAGWQVDLDHSPLSQCLTSAEFWIDVLALLLHARIMFAAS